MKFTNLVNKVGSPMVNIISKVSGYIFYPMKGAIKTMDKEKSSSSCKSRKQGQLI